MPGGVLHHSSHTRPSRSLVVRGSLARTFGGLACFLALTFLFVGGYILEDALANPIEAQAAAVIAGAFTIALATILLFYVIKPRNRHVRRTLHSEERALFNNASFNGRQHEPRTSLPYQGHPLDHSDIRRRGRV